MTTLFEQLPSLRKAMPADHDISAIEATIVNWLESDADLDRKVARLNALRRPARKQRLEAEKSEKRAISEMQSALNFDEVAV